MLTLQGIYDAIINAFFPTSGCKNMDFKKNLMQISYILDMYYILTPSPIPSMDPRADVVKWKLTQQGIYGASMTAFWQK